MEKWIIRNRERAQGFFDNILAEVAASAIGAGIFALAALVFKRISIWAMVIAVVVIVVSVIAFCTIKGHLNHKKCFRNIRDKFYATLSSKDQDDSFYEYIRFPVITDENGKPCEKIEKMVFENQNNEIVAVGGAGKTTLLLYLVYSCISKGWKAYKQKQILPFYVALSSLANHDGSCFISTTVFSDYLNKRHTGDNALEKLMRFAKKNHKKTILLLLDGFNELRNPEYRGAINAEITELTKKANIHIVLTSRFDAAGSMEGIKFKKHNVQGYSDDDIKTILGEKLKEKELQKPVSDSVLGMIRNPMMLSIYIEICQSGESADSVTTQGKMLQKYFASQEKKEIGEVSFIFRKWVYRFILPAIGFFMESNALFDVSSQELREYTEKAYLRANEAFVTSNMNTIMKLLDIDDNQDYDELATLAKRMGANAIEGFINRDIAIIIKTSTQIGAKRETTYGFYHQIYRDFFSALHIYNEVLLDMPSSDLFKRVEPKAIASYFCQIAGENYVDHKVASGDSGQHIHRLIMKLSNIKPDTPGYYLALRNLFDCMIMVHGGLFGFTYNGLDLSYYSLNGVLLSDTQGSNTVASRIDNCTLDYLRFEPQGHLQWVTAIDRYSNQKVVSGGRDGMIKLWNIPLSYCEYTLQTEFPEIRRVKCNGNVIYAGTGNGWILKVCVAEDGSLSILEKKRLCDAAIEYILIRNGGIVVGSIDGSIFLVDESVRSVECIYEYHGRISDMKMDFRHEKVFVVVYSLGLFELSLQNNNSMLNTNFGKNINSIDTNNFDQAILIASSEQLELADLSTGKRTVLPREGAHPIIAVFCGNSQKVVSAYNDNWIVLWNVQQQSEEKLYMHHDVVEDIMVIEEDSLIVSCSRDFSIIVYCMKSGRIIDEFRGESYWIRKLLLHGNQLLIPSTDGSIKAIDSSNGDNITYYYDDEIRPYSLCSIDNDHIVTAMVDGSICLWNITEHKYVDRRKDDSQVCMDDVEALEDGRFVGVNSLNEVFLWKAEKKKLSLLDHQQTGAEKERDIPGAAVNSIYYFKNHNGKDLIVSLHWNNRIILWTCENDKLKCLSSLINAEDAFTAAEDWPYCCTVVRLEDNVEKLAVVSRKGNVHIFSIQNGVTASVNHAESAWLKGHQSSLYSAIWMDSTLVVSDAKGKLLFVNKEGKQHCKRIHKSRIFLLKKINDSCFLSYSEDGWIKIWELNGTKLTRLKRIRLVPGLLIKKCSFFSNVEKNVQTKENIERYI